jgi:hypothetical protein
MKLSNQALGCLMVALQEAIVNQKDIVPVLKDFDFIPDGENESDSELVVANPPTVMKGLDADRIFDGEKK